MKITEARYDDCARLYDIVGSKPDREPDYFEKQLTEQKAGTRHVFVGVVDEQDVGYCILNWQPKYRPFLRLGIPEIQDLYIIPDFRQRGFAEMLISFCEGKARARAIGRIGIGVGLHSSYGPAQRLYFKLGYGPDGQGINYDRRICEYGEIRPVDDDLCLMLLKDL